jgi:hypothetical protein
MKVKEAIYKIKSNTYFVEYGKLISMNYEIWKPIYENKYLYPYRLQYGEDDKYSKSLFDFRRDNLEKNIPNYNKKIVLNLEFWGKVTAHIKIELNEYSRNEAKVLTGLHFHFSDKQPKFLWNSKFSIPENLDLSEANLKRFLLNQLSKYLYLNGLMAGIQYYYNCDKKDAMFYRKNKYCQNYIESGVSEDIIFKAIKKRFNIDSHVSLLDTVNLVNRIGKQAKIRQVFRYDFSWIWDFDGDIDEIENEFNKSFNTDAIYI